MQLLTLLLVYLPVGIGGVILLLRQGPEAERAHGSRGKVPSPTWWFYATPWPCPLCCSSARCIVGFLIVMTVPRLLNLAHQARQGLSACTASITGFIGGSRVSPMPRS